MIVSLRSFDDADRKDPINSGNGSTQVAQVTRPQGRENPRRLDEMWQTSVGLAGGKTSILELLSSPRASSLSSSYKSSHYLARGCILVDSLEREEVIKSLIKV